MSVEKITERLTEQGSDPESFVISTDRLLKAALLTGDKDLPFDIVKRTARLTGVSPEAALSFVLSRASRELQKDINELEAGSEEPKAA